jgi:hypothetical protein
MDKDQNGKLTLSELEEAAIGVGFSLEQVSVRKRSKTHPFDFAASCIMHASWWGPCGATGLSGEGATPPQAVLTLLQQGCKPAVSD